MEQVLDNMQWLKAVVNTLITELYFPPHAAVEEVQKHSYLIAYAAGLCPMEAILDNL